jgi:uncharacterized repeat protein (TIGR02543 family)
MKLLWDQIGEKLFETGVDRGVVFPYNALAKEYQAGIAWNGLTAVNESPSGAEPTDLYADNIKYVTLRSAETFGATIEAYMYPDAVATLDGTAEIATGVRIGQQSRGVFAFSYRTLIGNDTENTDYGYKIHLVYGCSISPSEKSRSTVNDSPEAITFSWELSTTPVNVTGYKATAHLEIDSTKVLDATKLAAFEDVLYGTANTDSRIPLPDEIMQMFGGEAVTYTVTFDTDGGSSVADQTIAAGGKVVKPADPTKADNTFSGWYSNAAKTKVWNFNTGTVDSDMTLYAKWTAV